MVWHNNVMSMQHLALCYVREGKKEDNFGGGRGETVRSNSAAEKSNVLSAHWENGKKR